MGGFHGGSSHPFFVNLFNFEEFYKILSSRIKVNVVANALKVPWSIFLNCISNWCTITSAPPVSQNFWNHTCKSNLKTLDCKLRNVLVFNSDIRERDSFKHEAYCTARHIYAFKHIASWTGKSQELININFLLTKSIHYQEISFWEMIKWSPQRIHFYLLPNTLN